ncbi:MAG: hypothetical protein JW832_14195 [Deltaproteobacteria bacterium]|nr:hypothetical protein [Deltaproteobacteria bacterium]
MSEKKNCPVKLPPETPAVICANCGAVALKPTSVCKPQGHGTKKDWCGTESIKQPSFCRNNVHTNRYQCATCGQVAVDCELLCAPEPLVRK